MFKENRWKMFLLHAVFFCLTVYNISEGRTVRARIGQNVSFVWTMDSVKKDAIIIQHNESDFARVWPAINFVHLVQPHRVKVVIDKLKHKTTMVTVIILNITKNDTGMYRLMRQRNSEVISDSVLLEEIGIDSYKTKIDTRTEVAGSTVLVTERKLTSLLAIGKGWTSDTNHQTTTAISEKEDTEEISHYQITSLSTTENKKDVRSENYLFYMALGLAAIVAAGLFLCLLHKLRTCLSVTPRHDRDETLQEFDPSENYWTIVSNTHGEMSTAVDNDFESPSDPQLNRSNTVSTDRNSQQSIKSDNEKLSYELDGYLNPINSCSVELDDYIHPVHSDPVNIDSVSSGSATEV